MFDPLFDLAVVLMAFFGGLGTVAGPVLGALILEPTQMWLNLQSANSYESEILFGALFLVVILFLPRGVLPTAAEYATSWQARLLRRRTGQPGVPAAAVTDSADAADDLDTARGPGTVPISDSPSASATGSAS